MEVWYGAEQVPASLSAPGGVGSVVTMGIFDGVHRGHQAVLGRVVELSCELACDGERPLAVAVTFDPHPRSVHQPEVDLPLITSLTDRLASLKDLGLDAVLVITCTLDFAAQSPQDFVRTWLEGLLGARAVVVGDDVRFGCRNSGDATTLEQIGRDDGFEVEIVSKIRSDEGRRWSSTWIRRGTCPIRSRSWRRSKRGWPMSSRLPRLTASMRWSWKPRGTASTSRHREGTRWQWCATN